MTRPDGQLLNPDAPGVLVTGAAGEVGHAILRGLAAGGARKWWPPIFAFGAS